MAHTRPTIAPPVTPGGDPTRGRWLLIGEDGDYTTAYTTIGIIALVSVVLTLITKLPRASRAATV
jgi:hypothetical protein